MKFNFDKSASDKLNTLFETLELNMSAGQLALDLIDGFEQADLLEVFQHVHNHQDYLELIKELYAFNDEDDFQVHLFNQHILPSINSRSLNQYQSDPYYQTIRGAKIKVKNIELVTKVYRKNQLFIFDDVVASPPYFQEKLSLSYPQVDYPYLALTQDDKIWMAIIPHEINTMKRAIDQAQGRVVVLGLGLGYYPFMISRKTNVERIIIVEKDKEIINIFNKHLLPYFSNRNKIEIIHADAYDYLAKHHLNFDFAFFDIYRSSNDDLDLYIKAKRQEKLYPQLAISYWLEGSMIAHLRRVMISYLAEVYYHYETKDSSPLDDLFAHIDDKLKDYVANSYEDIIELLSDDHILSLIK